MLDDIHTHTTMKKEDKRTNKTGMDEATIMEEVIVVMLRRNKVEENANLIEEDETKDKGILMMTNEDITMDSDIV